MPLTHRLLSGSPRPGSGRAGRPRSTGGSAGGRSTTASSSAAAVAAHAWRGVTGSWHVVGVDCWGLGGQWLPLGLGHGRDEGGLHEPLEVLAGCDRGDRGHEGTGHFPETGALLRGDTYTHRRRHTNRDTDTHTPNTHTHTDPVSEHRASGCGCVCHRQKATTPTLPLHRDAVLMRGFLLNWLLPPPSSSGKGCTVPAGGESHPGLVTLRWGGGEEAGHSRVTEPPGRSHSHTHSHNTPPPPQRQGEGEREALGQAFLYTHTRTHTPLSRGDERLEGP